MDPARDSLSPGQRGRRALWITAVVIFLGAWGFVADTTGIIGFLSGRNGPQLIGDPPGSDGGGDGPGPTGGATASASPTPDTPAPSTPTPAGPGQGGPLLPLGDVNLADLVPVAETLDLEIGAAVLDGRTYGSSLIYSCDLYCDKPRSSVAYNLGRQYTSFQAVVGVLDRTDEGEQVGHFEVYLDGAKVKSATATLGKPVKISLNVANHLRIELRSYRIGTTENAALAGARMAAGKSNYLPDLAWGDPVLRR